MLSRQDISRIVGDVEWHDVAARPAAFAAWPDDAPPAIAARGRALGVPTLWAHQRAAWDAARGGDNVILATRTASGKTLAYLLPIVEAWQRGVDATALLVYPTRSLARDQQTAIAAWTEPLAGVAPVVYDGDTRRSDRGRLRREARLLLTTPDMLHAGILPHHARWAGFLARLRYVVLDELHVYAGVFGAHVAHLVRRLGRVAAFHGRRPAYLAGSATVSQPGDLARRIIGAPAALIDADGAPHHGLQLGFALPGPERDAAAVASVALTAALVRAGQQTIVFCRSRAGAEQIVSALRAQLGDANRDVVRGYRAGYRSGERREIEAGLRAQRIRAVVSTSALELGVDLGGLDACVMLGYPGSTSGTWQRTGRVGRGGRPGLALVVGEANPLDAYVVRHAARFATAAPEAIPVDPANPAVLEGHLGCAAYERPLAGDEGWVDVPAPVVRDCLERLTTAGVLFRDGGGYHWVASDYAAARVSLRGGFADDVAIRWQRPGRRPRALGSATRRQALAAVHPGAVYLHDGRRYLVQSLDLDAGEALVEPAVGEGSVWLTAPRVERRLTLSADRRAARFGVLELLAGPATVETLVAEYRRFDPDSGETLEWAALDLPPHHLDTWAWCLAVPPASIERLFAAGVVGLGQGETDYRGPDWRAQRRAARARDHQRCRSCGQPESPDREHDVHHIRPFRDFGYRRGVNEAYRFANRLENLITLCRSCHQRVERGQRFADALARVGHLLRYAAPLFVRCAPNDLAVYTRRALPGLVPEGSETLALDPSLGGESAVVALYETSAGGVGLCAALWEVRSALLSTAREILAGCPCARGCPQCVGPDPFSGGPVPVEVENPKRQAALLVDLARLP